MASLKIDQKITASKLLSEANDIVEAAFERDLVAV